MAQLDAGTFFAELAFLGVLLPGLALKSLWSAKCHRLECIDSFRCIHIEALRLVMLRSGRRWRWLAAHGRSERIVPDAQSEEQGCWRRASVVDCCVPGYGVKCELGVESDVRLERFQRVPCRRALAERLPVS